MRCTCAESRRHCEAFTRAQNAAHKTQCTRRESPTHTLAHTRTHRCSAASLCGSQCRRTTPRIHHIIACLQAQHLAREPRARTRADHPHTYAHHARGLCSVASLSNSPISHRSDYLSTPRVCALHAAVCASNSHGGTHTHTSSPRHLTAHTHTSIIQVRTRALLLCAKDAERAFERLAHIFESAR